MPPELTCNILPDLPPELTIAQAIQTGMQQLAVSSDTPRLDSEILLLHALNTHHDAEHSTPKTRTWLLTWPETRLSETQWVKFQQASTARAIGKPVAYITNEQGFWSFELEFTADTLIPRPETELLVECALDKIPLNRHLTILDAGTGSGAIALAIASERSHSKITAADVSRAALEVAQRNAHRLELDNIVFLHSFWFESISPRRFDLIVSNPPYIPEADPHLQQASLQYEPQLALSSGADGLDALRIIILQGHNYLNTGGWLMFEHGYDQQQAVQSLLHTANFRHIFTINDLNDQPRVSMGQKCQ